MAWWRALMTKQLSSFDCDAVSAVTDLALRTRAAQLSSARLSAMSWQQSSSWPNITVPLSFAPGAKGIIAIIEQIGFGTT
jgi:hypothetical protein